MLRYKKRHPLLAHICNVNPRPPSASGGSTIGRKRKARDLAVFGSSCERHLPANSSLPSRATKRKIAKTKMESLFTNISID